MWEKLRISGVRCAFGGLKFETSRFEQHSFSMAPQGAAVVGQITNDTNERCLTMNFIAENNLRREVVAGNKAELPVRESGGNQGKPVTASKQGFTEVTDLMTDFSFE